MHSDAQILEDIDLLNVGPSTWKTVKREICGVQRPWSSSSGHSLSALVPRKSPVRCPAAGAVLSQDMKTVQCHQKTIVLQSIPVQGVDSLSHLQHRTTVPPTRLGTT